MNSSKQFLPAEGGSPVGALYLAARRELGKVIVGQDDLLEAVLAALFAGGHVLIEGIPGTAKTLLVRVLARLFDVPFKRIQFTPDLMPADITGTNVFDPRDQAFHFRPGPVFGSLLLGDEINRAPAKTQAALLEAMQERQVTVDGVSHALPDDVKAMTKPVLRHRIVLKPGAEVDGVTTDHVLDDLLNRTEVPR